MLKLTKFLLLSSISLSIFCGLQEDQNLINACNNGDFDAAEAALNSGADINVIDELGNSALMLAIYGEYHNLNLAKKLISRNADISIRNQQGITALMLACNCTNTEIVNLLLNKNANIHQRDFNGETVLMYATRNHGDRKPAEIAEAKKIIEILIKSGANINEIDNKGDSALMHAINAAAIDNIKLLLELGADIHVLNNKHETPLIVAIIAGEDNEWNDELSILRDIITLLIQYGVDIDTVDYHGKTAESYANELYKIFDPLQWHSVAQKLQTTTTNMPINVSSKRTALLYSEVEETVKDIDTSQNEMLKLTISNAKLNSESFNNALNMIINELKSRNWYFFDTQYPTGIKTMSNCRKILITIARRIALDLFKSRLIENTILTEDLRMQIFVPYFRATFPKTDFNFQFTMADGRKCNLLQYLDIENKVGEIRARKPAQCLTGKNKRKYDSTDDGYDADSELNRKACRN